MRSEHRTDRTTDAARSAQFTTADRELRDGVDHFAGNAEPTDVTVHRLPLVRKQWQVGADLAEVGCPVRYAFANGAQEATEVKALRHRWRTEVLVARGGGVADGVEDVGSRVRFIG